jgi:hypothetical protein
MLQPVIFNLQAAGKNILNIYSLSFVFWQTAYTCFSTNEIVLSTAWKLIIVGRQDRFKNAVRHAHKTGI